MGSETAGNPKQIALAAKDNLTPNPLSEAERGNKTGPMPVIARRGQW